MKIHVAKKKSHRCSDCGRMIPIGSKYWSNDTGEIRQHTNCSLFEDQPVLPNGYNNDRSLYKVK